MVPCSHQLEPARNLSIYRDGFKVYDGCGFSVLDWGDLDEVQSR